MLAYLLTKFNNTVPLADPLLLYLGIDSVQSEFELPRKFLDGFKQLNYIRLLFFVNFPKLRTGKILLHKQQYLFDNSVHSKAGCILRVLVHPLFELSKFSSELSEEHHPIISLYHLD